MHSKYREPRHTQLKHCMVWNKISPQNFFLPGFIGLFIYKQIKSILVISISNQSINEVWLQNITFFPPNFVYLIFYPLFFFFLYRRRVAWSEADRYNRLRLSEFLYSARDICCQHVWGWFGNQDLHWWKTEIDIHSQVSIIVFLFSCKRSLTNAMVMLFWRFMDGLVRQILLVQVI